MRHIRKLSFILMCFVMLFCLSVPAFAMTRIETEKDTSLTVHLAYSDTDIPGAGFHIYRVAEVSSTVKFTPTERFAAYPIDLEQENAYGWKQLAQTLKGYVAADSIEADASCVSDEKGIAEFNKLETGLYLVLGDKTVYDGYVYTIEPSLISLPNLRDNEWDYDCVISPKFSREEEPVPVVEIKVIKAWQDSGAESKRPSEISIKLMKGEELYESVTLNSDNNWRYTWEDLPQWDDKKLPIDWSVSEAPVTNYTVSIQQSENVFVIVNKYTGTTPPSPPNLPQTGQLWWPVPVLAFSGLCCIAIGALLSKKRNEQ